MKITLLPLVPDIPLPASAPAATRSPVPRGYGVQEQCLPFTAACALGLLIPAPFDFGFCLAGEVPATGRAFAPPPPCAIEGDRRVFYVIDHAASRFAGNAFSADHLPYVDEQGRAVELRPRQPGISFMDRADQAEFFKLHLPWVLRTPQGVDTHYGEPINRAAPLDLLTGLVETDWYAHPVNLVLRRPPSGALHVRRGDIIAQVFFIERSARRCELTVLARDEPLAATVRDELRHWFAAHAQDLGAYRRLARSHQGRIEPEPLPPGPDPA